MDASTALAGFGAAKGEVDPAEWSLFPISADEWRGLVFIRIATNGPSLIDWLGPIVPLAAHYPLESQKYFMEKNRDVAVDWKAYGENYLECYHCRSMHPGLCESLDISRYTIDPHPEHGLFHLYGPKRDGGMTDGLYFYRFPFLMLNLYQWGSSIATVEPWGRGVCAISTGISFRYQPGEGRGESPLGRMVGADHHRGSGDHHRCAAQPQTGIYDRGILSPRQERAVKAFQDMVRAALPGLEG